jgi:hypothetical protein
MGPLGLVAGRVTNLADVASVRVAGAAARAFDPAAHTIASGIAHGANAAGLLRKHSRATAGVCRAKGIVIEVEGCPASSYSDP